MTASESSPSDGQRDVTRRRPNPSQPYYCGLGTLGQECPLGPTSAGKCCLGQSHIKQSDDSSVDASGNKAGPNLNPCIPISNPWYRRNSLAINLAILSAGILLVFLAMRGNENVFTPGDLSPSHAQILGNTLGAARCSVCHPNSHVFNQGGGQVQTVVTQEQLCMNCHQVHIPDAIHGFAHDVSPEQWTKLVLHRVGNANVAPARQTGATSMAPTRCAQCHQEHHGDSQSLSAITDARCQSCHQQRFISFGLGHPEFRQLAKTTPRRIAFDHQTHFEKHFVQNNTSKDCQSCHDANSTDASGISRSVDYVKACASCHDAPLKASSTDGWAILQLPSLRQSDISSGEPHLVQWPAGAQYGYDGPITLPMRMLLSVDSKVARALALFPDGDLSHVQTDDTDGQAAIRTIAAGVRQLLEDTAHQGQQAWRQRLESVATKTLGRELSATEVELIQSMTAGLPPDLFRQIERDWFGNSATLAKDHPKTTRPLPADLVSLRQPPQDDLLDESDGDLLTPEEDVDDLLRSTSTDGIDQKPDAKSNARQVPSSESALAADESNEADLLQPRPIQESEQLATKKQRLMAAAQLPGGGWYLDPQIFSLRYMPRGHADSLVASWIQFAAIIDAACQLDSANETNHRDHASLRLPTWESNKIAVGQCTECHLLPDYSQRLASVNDWKGVQRGPTKQFTKFDHRPHLTLAQSADCKHCHQFNRTNDSEVERYSQVVQRLADQSPGDRNACLKILQTHFRDEFTTIEKSQCASCHRAGGAPQSCTQCHNYHVGADGLLGN